jgi:hypothetical protein
MRKEEPVKTEARKSFFSPRVIEDEPETISEQPDSDELEIPAFIRKKIK